MSAAQHLADYQSDFDFDTASELSAADAQSANDQPQPKRRRRSQPTPPPPPPPPPAASASAATDAAASRHEAAIRRQHLICMDAYSRHKQLVNDYIRYYGGSYKLLQRDTSGDKRDSDILRQHHRFLWDGDGEEADGEGRQQTLSWEQQLAKRYWDKLYKEYCLADLRQYKEAKIGLRWRTEAEVVAGKGQFSCGNKKCNETHGLASWEVNFAYTEAGCRRNALVKLRLCAECSRKLNYRKRHRMHKQQLTVSDADATAAASNIDQSLTHSLRAIRDHADANADANANSDADADADANDKEQKDAEEIWRQPITVQNEEVTREQEFDKYFTDMLL